MMRPVQITIQMLQELHSASEVLHFAIERYLAACTSLTTSSAAINSLPEISESITRELDSISSYEKKINQAKTAISRARNSSLSIAPISSLPDEIILRIFHLVFGAENCTFEAEVDAGRLPRHSLAISQVCSRWRQIALGSHHLWSHIDLSSYFPLCWKLVSRGHIFASRADDVPLDVHIIEQLSKTNYNADEAADDLEEFFNFHGSCVGSLEISFTSGFCGYYSGVISRCLERCTPHKFTRFILKFRVNTKKSSPSSIQSDDSPSQSGSSVAFLSDDEEDFAASLTFGNPVPVDAFLQPCDRRQPMLGHDSWTLDIANSQLEDALSQVTVLKLDKIFPYWTSRAYHGLVELRLVGWQPAGQSVQLTEQQLVKILKSSPGLRTLQFGLEITPAAVAQRPVRLEDLEVLHVQVDSIKSQQNFLRLILPGTKPLQMSIEHKYPSIGGKLPSRAEDEFHKFLRRSNIIELFLDSGSYVKLHLPTFLRLVPNLRVLILRHLTLEAIDPSFAPLTRPNLPQLHTLHLLSGQIHLDAFQWICNPSHLRLQRVTICQSTIRTSERAQPYILDQYIHLLKRIFPRLEILESYDDFDAFQIKEWDNVTGARNSAKNH